MGSARSARHYYASIASEYDAIFIHYGETVYATRKIAALNLDHLEGTYAEGNIIYYRDKNIKAPHNAFATLAGIHKAIENKKFRTMHNEDFVPQHFKFAYPEGGQTSIDKVLGINAPADSDTDGENAGSGDETANLNTEPTGSDTETTTEGTETTGGSATETTETSGSGEDTEVRPATMVKIPFSSYAQPYLTYDETTKLYTRYQFGGVHIDYNTKEPLTFNNIIIQIVKESNRDKNGYQDIEGYGDRDGHHNPVSGKGYYICEGKCIEITWEKNEGEFTMNYRTNDGELLVLRPGKTFIAVYPDFREDKLEIS
jgi:hypothetical protein